MTRGSSTHRRALRWIYRRLLRSYGPQHWWPARTAAEVVIGAILTQNTAWTNVERAIARLRRARMLSFRALRNLPTDRLEELIRPSGAFRIKAGRLQAFVDRLWRDHHGSLRNMLGGDMNAARERLLSIHGIGPETADAILLYAGNRPTFVVDAYTLRVLRRHRLIESNDGYENARTLFMASLPPDVPVYNEYHALLVAVGKNHCRAKAKCDGCPLRGHPHDGAL